MPITAAELMVKVGADTSAAERGLANFSSRAGGFLRGLTGAAEGAAGALNGMFTVAGGMILERGIANAALALRQLSSEAVDGYVAVERMKFALQSLTGRELVNAGAATSMAQALGLAGGRAEELFGYIRNLSLASPFDEATVANAFRQFTVYGFASEQAKRLTTDLVNLAAGSGLTNESLGRISLALGQMNTAGKVNAMDMRQLTEAGLPAWKILADAAGVTTAQMQKMVSDGTVPAQAAVEAMAQYIEKSTSGMAERQSRTFGGLLKTLDQLKNIGLTEYITPSLQAVQPYLDRMVTVLKDPAVLATIRNWGQGLGQLVGTGLQQATAAAGRFVAAFQQAGGGAGGLVQGLRAALNLDQLAANIQIWFSSIDWGAVMAGAGGQAMAFAEGAASWIGNTLGAFDWGGFAGQGLAFVQGAANWIATETGSVDWGGYAGQANGFVQGAAQWVAGELVAVDWSAVGQQAHDFAQHGIDWTADAISAVDWTSAGQSAGSAVVWTGKLVGWVVQQISNIDWGSVSVEGLKFEKLQQAVLTALADFGTGFDKETNFAASMETWRKSLTDAAKPQNIVDAVAAGISNIDWRKASFDFAGMVSQLASGIKNMNMSSVADSIVQAIALPFGGSVAIAQIGKSFEGVDWSNLQSAVAGAVAGIKWNEKALGDAFGSLGSAIMDALGRIGSDIGAKVSDLLDLKKLLQPIFNPTAEQQKNAEVLVGASGLPTFTWPPFPEFKWPAMPTFAWPAMPTFSWPALPTWTWPALPTWTWPALPEFRWPTWAPHLATGTTSWAGGMAIVGEQGPELVNLPRGSQVIPNRQTMEMLRQLGIPGFVDGLNPGPVGPNGAYGSAIIYGGDLASALKGVGKAATTLLGASDAFKSAVKDFNGMLQRVPGLFGTSPVTQQQLDLAKMGVPQNFADNYVRRLSDEVLNGKDWAGVDIKDAAKRAGIDPNLPAQAILELFKQAWNDSSLFADPKNLDLIDKGAVQDNMRKQAQSAQGKLNIQQFFGLSPDEMNGQTAQMSQSILTGLINGITPEKAGPVGKDLFTKVNAGMIGAADKDSAGAVIKAVDASYNLPESQQSLADVGATWADAVWNGFMAQAKTIPWGTAVNGGGGPTTPPSGTPSDSGGSGGGTPKNARGTAWWPGGMTWVGEQGPELVDLRRGARVYNAQESARMAGGVTVVVNAAVASQVDVEALAYKVAAVMKRSRA